MAATFDDLTDAYDAMIDWPRRLAREGAFYRRWFERHDVGDVLDAACGTGRHAAMFHDWGLRVEAADLSEAMIARARSTFGQPEGLRWVVRPYDAPCAADPPFDAAICVGNSLALAPDMATVSRAMTRMLGAIRSGGLVVVQVVNLWRLPEGPCQWQKHVRASLRTGEALISKGVHRCGTRGYVELIVAGLEENADVRTESVAWLGLEADELASMARADGAAKTTVLGGYDDAPFDRGTSADLIFIAEKA